MDSHTVINYPLMGEKATTLRERENKLSFVVEKTATKKEIKAAVEALYNVKVVSVSTVMTTGGKKKAHVKLSKEFSAEEIASQLGVL